MEKTRNIYSSIYAYWKHKICEYYEEIDEVAIIQNTVSLVTAAATPHLT